MNVLQGLQAAQAEADPEFFQNFEEEGADADEEEFWDNLDIGKLSRYELRNHLAARDLSTKGRKRDLMIRLEESIQNDKAEAQALREAKEAFFRKEVDLEESGSVYAIGRNGDGQLGLGHLEDVDEWSCLKELRGLAVKHVAAGPNIAFAVTQEHEVFTWGGRGVGQVGIESPDDGSYLSPTIVETFKGEEVRQFAVGPSHAVAISEDGDCYTWGFGSNGQLGLGSNVPKYTPQIVVTLQKETMALVACGQSHTAGMTANGKCYSWGNAVDGRLGLGTTKRAGVKKPHNRYFPEPVLIPSLVTERVSGISCGPSHTVCITTTGVFSWGTGAGYRLGLGDTKDRSSPCRVEEFDGIHVKQVSCGTWHTAVVALAPPFEKCGWVYTWGSGYHGQLGQGSSQSSPKPNVIKALQKMHVLASLVVCGSHHNAIISDEGELYTWGSNRGRCLGRDIQPGELGIVNNGEDDELDDISDDASDGSGSTDYSDASNSSESSGEEDSDDEIEPVSAAVPYSPVPGHVNAFGAICECGWYDRNEKYYPPAQSGRGFVRSIAIGREFTVVASFSYEGPTEERAFYLTEKHDQKAEERHLILMKEAAQKRSDERKELEQIRRELLFNGNKSEKRSVGLKYT